MTSLIYFIIAILIFQKSIWHRIYIRQFDDSFREYGGSVFYSADWETQSRVVMLFLYSFLPIIFKGGSENEEFRKLRMKIWFFNILIVALLITYLILK